MNGNISNKVIIVLAMLGFTACKAHKQLVVNKKAEAGAAVSPAVSNTAAKITAIKAKQVGFNTFSGKAKTKLEINGNSNDVTLNIRIQHNQKIWVSITAFAGIEAARAMITPDSIIVLNRLESTYLKKPFSYIYKYASRDVNYHTVEALLVGNAIPDLLRDSSKMTADTGNVILSGTLHNLVYQLIVNPGLKVTQTSLANDAEQQSLMVKNSDFTLVEDKTMPAQINITSTVRNKNIKASLHYNKVELNQVLEFPFSIPKRFSEVE